MMHVVYCIYVRFCPLVLAAHVFCLTSIVITMCDLLRDQGSHSGEKKGAESTTGWASLCVFVRTLGEYIFMLSMCTR